MPLVTLGLQTENPSCEGSLLPLALWERVWQSRFAINDGHKYPRFKPHRQGRRFFGVASFRKGRARNKQTEWASATRNTHDHTASKEVSDRLRKGITHASSTFLKCYSSECSKGITSKGRTGVDLPLGHRGILKQACWPAPDRRDIRGKPCLKQKEAYSEILPKM